MKRMYMTQEARESSIAEITRLIGVMNEVSEISYVDNIKICNYLIELRKQIDRERLEVQREYNKQIAAWERGENA